MPTSHPKIKEKKITLDAKGISLGRLASTAAVLVRGKSFANFSPNLMPHVTVVIKNIQDVKITEKKLNSNVHYRFSGYPGGLKSIKWLDGFNKDPQAFFKNTVRNMLPANKLRKDLLKMIKFE
jgi:large subunit ribosomal protein L13